MTDATELKASIDDCMTEVVPRLSNNAKTFIWVGVRGTIVLQRKYSLTFTGRLCVVLNRVHILDVDCLVCRGKGGSQLVR